MTTTYPDGAQSVFAQVMRASVLDVNGFPAVGSNTFTTNQLLKCSFAPVVETGVDLVTINANADIASHFKHGDMIKYYSVQLEVSSPDPILHQMLVGGTVLTDSATALTTPTAPTGTPSASGGTLATASYYYIVTAANQYGETVGSPASTAISVTGPTGSVALTVTSVTGAVYYRWYGRTSGAQQLLGQTTGNTFTDTGALTPAGSLPATNTTAGPGNDTGFQSPALGIVGNPNGVSLEFWAKAILNGSQAPYLQYWRWVIPGCKNFRDDVKTFQPAILENVYMGQAFENPNWGAGPFGDWNFDSTKTYQYARNGFETVPTSGLSPVAATA